MKKLTNFLIMILFFSSSKTMHKGQSVKYKRSLAQVHRYEESAKYHLQNQDLENALKVLSSLLKSSRHLSELEKLSIHNRVVEWIIQLLPLWDTIQAEFRQELYLSKDKDLSSGTEDEASYVLFNDEECERQLKPASIYMSQKEQQKFNFLVQVIKKLGEVRDHIKKVQGDLRIACYDGNFPSFKKICGTYGRLVDFDDLNGIGKSLLHHAVAMENDEIIRYLFSQGVNAESVDMSGYTPFLLAIKLKKEASINLLLEYHANPYMDNKGGICSEGEGSRIGGHVLSHKSVNAWLMVKDGAYDNKVIKKAVTKYIHNLSNEEKFRFMAQAGKENELKRLLKKVTKKNSLPESIKQLIGNIINSVDSRNGKSALHYATEQRKPLTLLYLINIGVNLDIADNKGDTPLHYAVINNYEEGVALLLGLMYPFNHFDTKAQIDIKNNCSYTPEKIAQLLRYTDIIRSFAVYKKRMQDYTNSPLSSPPSSSSAVISEGQGMLLKPKYKKKPKSRCMIDEALFEEADDTEKLVKVITVEERSIKHNSLGAVSFRSLKSMLSKKTKEKEDV